MASRNWRQASIANENATKIRKALQRSPLRKIEVSRATGLSRPTVDKHLQALQQRNEVYRKDRAFHLSKTGLAALKKTELVTKLSQLKDPVDITLLEGQKRIPEIKVSSDRVERRFITDVENLSGQKIFACYVCGKCSAGCPISSLMDIQPHQIVRLIQLGQEEEVLNSRTIWLCSSCFTCASRCPRGISLTAIMEALRALVLRKGIDHVSPSKIPPDFLAEAPQLALVSCLRKLSS